MKKSQGNRHNHNKKQEGMEQNHIGPDTGRGEDGVLDLSPFLHTPKTACCQTLLLTAAEIQERAEEEEAMSAGGARARRTAPVSTNGNSRVVTLITSADNPGPGIAMVAQRGPTKLGPRELYAGCFARNAAIECFWECRPYTAKCIPGARLRSLHNKPITPPCTMQAWLGLSAPYQSHPV